MKRLLLTLLVGATVLTANAQNDVVINSENVRFPMDLTTVFPEDVVKASFDINDVGRGMLLAFAAHHLFYEHVYLAAIISEADTDFRKVLQKTFAKNKKLYDKVYATLLPTLQAFVKKMTPAEHKKYLDFLQGGINYLNAFNLKKETEDMQRLEASDTTSFRAQKGDFNAFLFRRIYNKELSQKDCLSWLNRFYKDFKAAITPKSRPEDNYYIAEDLNGNFFRAEILGELNTDALMRKTGEEQYSLLSLPGVKTIVTTHNVWGRGIALIANDGTNTWAAFEMKDGSQRLFMLPQDNKPALSVEVTDAKKMQLYSISAIRDGVWTIPGYAVLCLNNKGELEINLIVEYSPSVFEFLFADGSKRLLSLEKNESDGTFIPSNVKAFKKVMLSYYFLTHDNKLYVSSFNRYSRKYDHAVFDLPQTPRYFNELSDFNAVLSYENGSFEVFCPYAPDNKVYRMPLPPYNVTQLYMTRVDGSPQRYVLFFTADNKSGIMNTEGKVIMEPKHEAALPTFNPIDQKDYFFFGDARATKRGLADANGKELIPDQYSMLSLPQVLVQGGKTCVIAGEDKDYDTYFGIVDLSNKPLLPIEFNEIVAIPEGKAFLMGKQKNDSILYALYSSDLKPLTPFIFSTAPVYDTIVTFDPETFQEIIQMVVSEKIWLNPSTQHQTIVLLQNGKKTLYDFSGKMLISPDWDEISYTSDKSLLLVGKGEMVGVVNTQNKTLIPADYLSIRPWLPQPNAPLRFVARNRSEQFELFDANGKKITPSFSTQEATEIIANDSLPLCFVGKTVGEKNLYSPFDTDFKPIGALTFEPITDLIVMFDPETFEEIQTNIALPPGTLYWVKDKTLILQTNGKKGLYNFELKPIIPAEYDKIEHLYTSISNDFYSVGTPDAMALFDSKGNQLTNFVYNSIGSFENGLFSAVKGNETVKLDTKGKEVKN